MKAWLLCVVHWSATDPPTIPPTMIPTTAPTPIPTFSPTSGPSPLPTPVPTSLSCADIDPGACNLTLAYCDQAYCPTCPGAKICDRSCGYCDATLPPTSPSCVDCSAEIKFIFPSSATFILVETTVTFFLLIFLHFIHFLIFRFSDFRIFFHLTSFQNN